MTITEKELVEGLVADLTKDRAELIAALKAIMERARNQRPEQAADQLYEIFHMARIAILAAHRPE